MSSLSNIFIVSSPLQLLNCIEAKYHFNTANNILLVLHLHETGSKSHINSLIVETDWLHVAHLQSPKTYKDKLTFPYYIKMALKSVGKNVDKLFFGEYRSVFTNHIVNCFHPEKNYLVDDGMAVLSYSKFHENNSLNKIKHRLFGYQTTLIKHDFFTLFDLQNKKVIRNNFYHAKSKIVAKPTKNQCLFIGQPLVELGIVNRNYYKKYLSDIVKYLDGTELIYALHRRNDMDWIRELADELDFKYIRYDTPLELALINSDYLPKIIATSFSTAIYTLKLLFEDIEAISIEINTDEIHTTYSSWLNIKEYNSEFNSIGIISMSMPEN
jgi:hypothetical protein